YDGTGANELDSTLTDANGCYSFVVPAGDYTVGVEFDATKYFLAPQGQGNDPELDSNFDPTNGRSGVITVAGGQVRNDVDALLCIICTGVQAMANNNLPACGLANDPVMTITAPVIGKTMTFSITSNFPNALFFLFASVGPPQHVLFPGTTCNIWLDLSNFQQIAIFPLDANGGWSLTIPVHPDPTLAGIEVVFQGRACIPSIPGPIAGVPDWPGNASHIIFGCP
ncbi:MAG: hypothetical protein KDB53_18155, partial [Planctomycetes bacterium]|nr:hypothetical protein [Planctomycetota bacterium]